MNQMRLVVAAPSELAGELTALSQAPWLGQGGGTRREEGRNGEGGEGKERGKMGDGTLNTYYESLRSLLKLWQYTIYVIQYNKSKQK